MYLLDHILRHVDRARLTILLERQQVIERDLAMLILFLHTIKRTRHKGAAQTKLIQFCLSPFFDGFESIAKVIARWIFQSMTQPC